MEYQLTSGMPNECSVEFANPPIGLKISVIVAFTVGFLALVLATPAGYGLNKLAARFSNRIIMLLFALPLILIGYHPSLINTLVYEYFTSISTIGYSYAAATALMQFQIYYCKGLF